MDTREIDTGTQSQKIGFQTSNVVTSSRPIPFPWTDSSGYGMPATNDNFATWIPPAESWDPDPAPVASDPYNVDSYFPDPYA